MGEILPELYLHELAQGDFELALRGLLGEDAPLSSSSIQRLKARWEEGYKNFREEDLSEIEPVYLWVDGIYVKAGIGKEKAALLIVIVGTSDGQKKIIMIEVGHRESKESWGGCTAGFKKARS